jgi:dTDP-4-dehydrorhamnose 3,5-epimerase
MKVTATNIAGAVIVEPDIFKDDRGSFFETFRVERYADAGIRGPFLQDNCSISRRGVLRGLHYQISHPQGHLITLTQGSIFDVGVDLRRNSPTFGRVITTTLAADPPRQLFLPPGVAHGFCVMTDIAEIWYKCTEIYHADDEGGLLWSDPDLGIDWPLKNSIISPRDAAYPRLKDIPAERLPHIAF